MTIWMSSQNVKSMTMTMTIDRPRSEVHPEAEDLALETAPGPGPPPRFTALKASRIAVICCLGLNINKPR